MALINCDECGKEFSDKANACPNCGCPNETLQKNEAKETIKKEPPLEPPFEIKGDENYKPRAPFYLTFLIGAPLGYLIILAGGIKSSQMNAFLWVVIMVILVGLFISSGEIAASFPKTKRKREKSSQLYEYFKKRYPLLNQMKPEYQSLGIINLKEKDLDSMLFEIYMEAFKKNADAIVINNNSVITHVGATVTPTLQRNVSSSTSREIMATFVKY